MAKHRKQQQYRRMVVAAVAVGAVGVPSAAMACVKWGDDTGSQAGSASSRTAWEQGQDTADQITRSWNHTRPEGHRGSPAPTTTAPETPAATPSAREHREHTEHAEPTEHRRTAPARTHGAAPRPKATASAPATAPAKKAAPAATKSAPAAPKSATPAAVKTAVESAAKTATGHAPKPAPKPVRTTAAATPAPATPAPAATASGAVAQVVQLVNAERAKVGCSPLTVNAELTKAAQAHSDDMAAHQNMSHTGSDGSDPGARITAAGYQWNAYGENVAYGYSTPAEVMAGWMASPGHRENILNCSYKEIGVGLAQPGSYWTQDFGTAQ
ncbi:CAP domain-containing protein [Streptomyces sp. LaPpAH-108]|uniref:CAP domain-containing protein n=1 Tax=Streptomyces sp. LaPpAH-108 TaxID=1155714 RepID=UPI00035EA7F2|nr:CAP domain-containing protein [Streptomyces sp. LaPpAH-108]